MQSGLTEVVATADSKLKDYLSFLSDIKEAGSEKISMLVSDILGLAPLIELTGFNMKELSLDATIPPGIVISFLKEKEVDAQTIEKTIGAKQRQGTAQPHCDWFAKSGCPPERHETIGLQIPWPQYEDRSAPGYQLKIFKIVTLRWVQLKLNIRFPIEMVSGRCNRMSSLMQTK